MEFTGKEKKVYKGIWIPFLIIVIVPFAFYFFFHYILSKFEVPYPEHVMFYMSIGFAGVVGSAFGFSCLFSGFVHDIFLAMINRIKDTLEFFDFGSKEAFKWYFSEFINDGGIILWIFLLELAANVFIMLFGFINFYNWYFAI